MAFAVLLPAARAQAAPDISKIEWQISSGRSNSGKAIYKPIAKWIQRPNGKSPGHMRIVATLTNKGPVVLSGNILRCAVSAHLVPADKSASLNNSFTEPGPLEAPGLWALPFWLEERRVPKINPGQTLSATIPHIDLRNYLKKLSRTGFWPDSLKVQLMLEPRIGDNLEKNMHESIIKIDKAE